VNKVNTLPAQNLELLRVIASGKYSNHWSLDSNLDSREARIAWLWLDEWENVVLFTKK